MFSHTNPFINIGLLLIVAFLGVHCEHVGPLEPELEQEGEAPTLSGIQGLFTQNCALSGCHTGPNALLGVNLSEGQSYASLVGKPSAEVPGMELVSANRPDLSYLIVKLEGSAEMAPGTLLMPMGRSPLKKEDIDRVRAWIAAGALDN